MPDIIYLDLDIRNLRRAVDQGDNTYAPLVMVAPWPLTNRAFAAVAAPGVGATIVSTTIAVAGTYRVEAEIYSTNAAGVNNYVGLFHAAGAKGQVLLPTPGSLRIVWGRVTVAAGDTLTVQNGAAAGAGTLAGGEIRAYRIS